LNTNTSPTKRPANPKDACTILTPVQKRKNKNPIPPNKETTRTPEDPNPFRFPFARLINSKRTNIVTMQAPAIANGVIKSLDSLFWGLKI